MSNRPDPHVNIALATKADIPAMAAIYHQEMPNGGYGSKHALQRQIMQENAVFLKAVRTTQSGRKTIEEIVGFMGGEITDDIAEGTHLYIKTKREGTGMQLMNAFIQFVQTAGAKTFKADTTQEGRAFCSAMGFEMDGYWAYAEIDAYLAARSMNRNVL